MSNNGKSVVEETLLQIKAVENAISENAKGILASTMKEEISELVKESLNGSKKRKKSLKEQEEELPVDDAEVEDTEDDMSDEEPEDDMDVEDEDDMDVEMDTEVSPEGDNEMAPLDMTNASPDEVLKVFKAMGDQDGIIVKKDGAFVHLSDTETDKDYLIQMESNKRRNMKSNLTEETLYELYVDSSDESGEEYESYEPETDSTLYELEVEEMDDMDEMYEMDDMDDMDEMYEMEDLEESFKSKGRVGKMKFSYPKKLKKGVTEMSDEDEEFSEWSEEEDADMVESDLDDAETETSEAARTLGNGRNWGRNGLPKPRTSPRHVRTESVNKELNLLKEKNEEYKKALDFFRNKLNEVAVFNSNLAYSTRLFTEHSTTKQEKINILRRFDNVETLKESKNLYKSIKNELDGNSSSSDVVTESIQRKVTKTPQNGSSSNLIESKTYENPQFLRMKDLMSKIK